MKRVRVESSRLLTLPVLLVRSVAFLLDYNSYHRLMVTCKTAKDMFETDPNRDLRRPWFVSCVGADARLFSNSGTWTVIGWAQDTPEAQAYVEKHGIQVPDRVRLYNALGKHAIVGPGERVYAFEPGAPIRCIPYRYRNCWEMDVEVGCCHDDYFVLRVDKWKHLGQLLMSVKPERVPGILSRAQEIMDQVDREVKVALEHTRSFLY